METTTKADRYRFIFEHSAVSLWEEDISEVRSRLKGLTAAGVTDLRAYLLAHPEVVDECVGLINVIDVNAATLTLYGAKDKSRLLGPFRVNLDDEARESFALLFVGLMEGKSLFESESTAETADGRKLSLLIRSYVPAEHEDYPYMLVSVIDISRRKAAERVAEQLRRRLEFILGVTKTGLDIIDSNYNVRYVDAEWQKTYGDPTGRKCYEYFAGAKAVCPGCRLSDALASMDITVGEEVLPKERNRPIQVTSIPFQDENGEWLIAEVNVDISERKRVEERFARYTALVESSDDAIVGIGADRLVNVWNKGAERIYGFSAAEIIGKPTSLLIPPGLEEEAREMRERLARGENIEHFETVRRHKDGSLIDVSLSLSAVRDAAGSMIGMASVARDITAEKALKAQAARAERLASHTTLAGGVAHQFNNIHTVIAGYLQLMEEAEDLPATLQRYAREAQKGIARASEMTDRLLALTRTRAPETRPMLLDELIPPILDQFEKRIADEGISVRTDLGKTAPVSMDSVSARLVVTSLIANALDAMLDLPLRQLTLRTGKEAGQSFLEVGDTGCGMSPDELSRIFSPFHSRKGEWAAPGSPQARLKGVGLSLAICHVSVADVNGRIEVRSVPGEGTTFRVLLPSTT